MTITAKNPRASEANHWYTRDGAPMYTVEAAKGGQRPTTLRDARKLNLVPSVTTIMNVAAKPALMQWMQRQVLLATLTLPRRPNEPEDEWIERIMDDSKEQGRAAADLGTSIHASIQSFYEGTQSDSHQEHVRGTIQALQNHFGHQGWIAERSFAHELGYGGKVDLHSPGYVVDIKTKDFTDPNKISAYNENLMQLSAYRVGLGMPEARCANVFVSRTVPGLVKVIEWEQSDLARGWGMFLHLLGYWQGMTQHK
jgi:hypothetical protein